MAAVITVVSVRKRRRGTEISFMADGTERVLMRRGWSPPADYLLAPDKAEMVAWANPRITKIEAQEARVAAEETAADADTQRPAFLTWVRDNKADPEVRQLLRPLRELWRGRTS